MKVVTYKCDLCREVKDKKDLLQMYFRSAPLPQKYILEPVNEVTNVCDKHICIGCIEVVKEFINQPKF